MFAEIKQIITRDRNIIFQDTVVAVEALAKYAARTYKHETNLVVTMEGTDIDGDEQITITSQNRLLAQRRRLQVLPASMHFVITGTGCALIQVRCAATWWQIEGDDDVILKASDCHLPERRWFIEPGACFIEYTHYAFPHTVGRL